MLENIPESHVPLCPLVCPTDLGTPLESFPRLKRWFCANALFLLGGRIDSPQSLLLSRSVGPPATSYTHKHVHPIFVACESFTLLLSEPHGHLHGGQVSLCFREREVSNGPASSPPCLSPLLHRLGPETLYSAWSPHSYSNSHAVLRSLFLKQKINK